MPVDISRFSRLRFATLAVVDDIEFWDTLDLPEIPEQPDDLVYQVEGFERLDRLAHRYYNDSRLWWVIAVVNDIELVPTEFNVGDKLRIPSPRYVTQVLFKKATTQRRV